MFDILLQVVKYVEDSPSKVSIKLDEWTNFGICAIRKIIFETDVFHHIKNLEHVVILTHRLYI